MTKIIGYDAVSTSTNAVLARAVAKGVRFVCMYFKYMTPQAIQLISGHFNIQIVSIYETTGTRALGGSPMGARDGAQAKALAQQFGQPAGSAIYATADFDAVPGNDATVMAYFRAFKDALGDTYRMGVYANGAVCQETLGAGIADLTWVMGGAKTRGTQAFIASGKATMMQEVGDRQGLALGIDVDSDIAFTEDFGGWAIAATSETLTSQPADADVMEAVKGMQRQFAALGLYDGQIDGLPGPKTQKACAAYLAWRHYQL